MTPNAVSSHHDRIYTHPYKEAPISGFDITKYWFMMLHVASKGTSGN